MLYTKGSIVGYAGVGEFRTKMVTIKFDCLMADTDLMNLLQPIREQFNEMNDALDFKLTLESKDI
jgi:hypothetical protein